MGETGPRRRPTKPMTINAPISGRPRARSVTRGAASTTPRAGDARRRAVSWLDGFGKQARLDRGQIRPDILGAAAATARAAMIDPAAQIIAVAVAPVGRRPNDSCQSRSL